MTMRCPEFLSRFSEYRDGLLSDELTKRLTEHAASCEACSRYQAVLDTSTRVLRTLPGVVPEPSFRDSLAHRIYVDQELEKVWMGARGSAVTTGAVLALAIVLTALAWSPTFRTEPVREARQTEPVTTANVRSTPVGTFSSALFVEPALPSDGLWQSPSALLHAYSALSTPTRNPLVRPARTQD